MLTISDIKGCVIIPTYNNDKTLRRVVQEIMTIVPQEVIIIVNDGSTDSTNEILKEFENKIHLVNYKENKGKGYALRKGFKKAIELGFENAITIDSDGQHYPQDIPLLIEKSFPHILGCAAL